MKKITKYTTAFVLAILISVPVLVLAYTTHQKFASYSVDSQETQYMQFSESDSNFIYQNSNLTVSSILADSGSSSCTWCKVKVTHKKKGLLGIYSTTNSTTVTTSVPDYYDVKNYGNVGTGTFRHYIENTNHQNNTGTMRVNVQDYN